VAELADALDLGSSGQPWGFDSPPSHFFKINSLQAASLRIYQEITWTRIMMCNPSPEAEN
jgi:hypothetical protein